MSASGEYSRLVPGTGRVPVGKPTPRSESVPSEVVPTPDPAILNRENQALREKLDQQSTFFVQEIQNLRARIAQLETNLADTSRTLGDLANQQVENRQKWQDFTVELAQEVVRSFLGDTALEGKLPLEKWIEELMSRIHGPGRLVVRVHPQDREMLGFVGKPQAEANLQWIEDGDLKRGQWIVEGAQWKAEVDWRPWVDEVFHEIRGMLGRESLP